MLKQMAAIVSGVAFLVMLAVSGFGIYSAWRASDKLSDLRAEVDRANRAAQEKLERLTTERDEKQRLLDQLSIDREESDAHAQAEIARLKSELANTPIRVQYVLPQGGNCGGSPEGGGAADTGSGGEGPATVTGVLPAENSRRLGLTIEEIELLSAAYASCRDYVFKRQQILTGD